MATVRRRWSGPRILLKGMLVGIVLLTVGSIPFLGIGSIVVPIILLPLWVACLLLLAYRTGRWTPSRGLIGPRRAGLTPSVDLMRRADRLEGHDDAKG